MKETDIEERVEDGGCAVVRRRIEHSLVHSSSSHNMMTAEGVILDGTVATTKCVLVDDNEQQQDSEQHNDCVLLLLRRGDNSIQSFRGLRVPVVPPSSCARPFLVTVAQQPTLFQRQQQIGKSPSISCTSDSSSLPNSV